jgi:hypothetical protein
MTPEQLAEIVARVMKASLAPVVARVASLETTSEKVVAAESALRERVAVVEVKPLIQGPSGTDGKDGADGRDGFDLKAFHVALEPDMRTLHFTFGDGEQTKEARVKVPWLLDRGVYQNAQPYEPGDMVSWDGSGWVAREETAARPGASGPAWRLFFKRWQDRR